LAAWGPAIAPSADGILLRGNYTQISLGNIIKIWYNGEACFHLFPRWVPIVLRIMASSLSQSFRMSF